MLSYAVIFTFCTCAVLALPQIIQPSQVPIIFSRADLGPDGSYHWSFESGDGTKQDQSGQELSQGGQAVQGVAEWVDPEGRTHKLEYTADERGYLPSSEDLPVGPPVPEAIVRALQWNAAHPEEEIDS